MEFEWHDRKALTNLKKHAVSFEEAATVFVDELALSARDPDHSLDEERHIIFGASAAARILVVSYTERGENVRIISARHATPAERLLYEED